MVSSIPLILGYNEHGKAVKLVEGAEIGTDTVSANVFVSGGVDLATLLGGGGTVNTYTENVLLGACDNTTVTHSLGGRPVVTLYDSATNAVLNITVNYVDDNTIVLNSAVSVHVLVVCIGGPSGEEVVPGESSTGFLRRYAFMISS